jgi:hypothetical protein
VRLTDLSTISLEVLQEEVRRRYTVDSINSNRAREKAEKDPAVRAANARAEEAAAIADEAWEEADEVFSKAYEKAKKEAT